MTRHTINRDFLETIRKAGDTRRDQEYADDSLRGFGVKEKTHRRRKTV